MIEKIMKREISGIEYTLTLKNIKNKYLRIYKDGNISVSAGIKTPLKEIDDFVLSHADKIKKYRKKSSPAPICV